jgi:hypothetical protein
MSQFDSTQDPRKAYDPPAVMRVHVDPQQELLQATGCAQIPGQGAPPACFSSPGS